MKRPVTLTGEPVKQLAFYQTHADCVDSGIKAIAVGVQTYDADFVLIDFGGAHVLAQMDWNSSVVHQVPMAAINKSMEEDSDSAVRLIVGWPLMEPDVPHDVTFEGQNFRFMWWKGLSSPTLVAISIPRAALEAGEGPDIELTLAVSDWSRVFPPNTSDDWCSRVCIGHMEGAVKATYMGPSDSGDDQIEEGD